MGRLYVSGLGMLKFDKNYRSIYLQGLIIQSPGMATELIFSSEPSAERGFLLAQNVEW